MSTVLTPGDGYGIVAGLGLGFAAIMIVISFITNRYTKHSLSSSEEFTSASRSLNPGLLASGIVSAATWAATLLQSATVTYLYGISGGYWYGAGSVSQIQLFAQNAIMLKRNAPGAHTFLEPIRVRWGKWPHALFIFYGLGTNLLLTAQLITGGADTIVALTNANIYATCVLIPLTVVIYTFIGGLRATFFSDFLHTTLIFAIILIFMFLTYATNTHLGSPSKVYDLLTEAAKNYPLAGNAEGSYLTFRSTDGLVFGIIVIISGVTTVFMDQTYWQRAVASKASTSVTGYLYGGTAFLPVPWAFSTAAALALVALSAGPGNMVVERLTNPGNVAPAAAAALLGDSGATLLLVVLFLAVTSAASAELVAVSSIFVYDIYKPYVNPSADEKTIVKVTHFAVCGYGVIMAVLGIVFFKIGISLSWLYGLTGVMFSCGVGPVGFAIRTKIGNKNGCVAASVIGFACAITAWIVTAKEYYGVVNVTSTGGTYPQLAGNAAGFFISTSICAITSFLWPANYDFEELRTMNFAPADVTETAVVDGEDISTKDPEKIKAAGGEVIPVNNLNDASEEQLFKDFKYSCYATGFSFVLLCIVIPAFAAIPKVWSKSAFTCWIVIAFIYTFIASFIVVFWPVWESRKSLAAVAKGIFNDVSGKGFVKA
ncbi:solute symporter family transporter [Meredithblackwellia eburnea MCA 4105]